MCVCGLLSLGGVIFREKAARGGPGVRAPAGAYVFVSQVERVSQNICPHQNFELVEGSLSGTILTCKAHLWQFDLNVCKGINPEHSELAQYPIEIRGEGIYVDPSGDEPKYSH